MLLRRVKECIRTVPRRVRALSTATTAASWKAPNAYLGHDLNQFGVAIRNAPGKGAGVFATRSFRAGEVVFTDSALAVCPPLQWRRPAGGSAAREIAEFFVPARCPHCLRSAAACASPTVQFDAKWIETEYGAAKPFPPAVAAALSQQYAAMRKAEPLPKPTLCGCAGSATKVGRPMVVPPSLLHAIDTDSAALPPGVVSILQHFEIMDGILRAVCADTAERNASTRTIAELERMQIPTTLATLSPAVSAAAASDFPVRWPSAPITIDLDANTPVTALPLFAPHFRSLLSTARSNGEAAAAAYWFSDAGRRRLSAIVQTNLFRVALFEPFAVIKPQQPGIAIKSPDDLRVRYEWRLRETGGVALYRRARYMNHACSGQHTVSLQSVPSFGADDGDGARWRVPAHTAAASDVAFVAARDIRSGDELTWSYTDQPSSPLARQRLKATYGFDCTCPGCVAAAAAQ